MKAIVWTKYGAPDVLQLQEVAAPTPKDNEVLIRVRAATVTAGDCEARSLQFSLWLSLPMRAYVGIRKPKRITILGQELAGDVVAVGKAVTRFNVGDPVFGTTGFRFGAYAEYACLPAESDAGVLAIKPANLTYEEAATIPTGGLEALHFLRLGNLQAGQRILINGAGGSIGTAAVQLAKHFGADITAVDSAGKLEMLRSLGASHVIDYAQEDFTKRGETYDVILDVIGKSPFARTLRSLTPHGRYLIANPTPSKMLRGAWVSKTSSRQVIFKAADRKVEDLLYLKDLAEAGTLKPVIDRCYPLAETADAHRYVETGQKQGSLVITV